MKQKTGPKPLPTERKRIPIALTFSPAVLERLEALTVSKALNSSRLAEIAIVEFLERQEIGQ